MLMQKPSWYEGKSILITGVCGSVGRELLRQLASTPNVVVTGIDNNESDLFFLAEQYGSHEDVEFFLGDLRDRDTLRQRFEGQDVVFHAAAFKHVGLSERSPRDAIQCNVIGTQNVIEAANSAGVGCVNFTSSDKAVNPTNVMGTCKLLGERLMTAAAVNSREKGTTYFSTRFGNVLGSRGSVVPLFRQQIAAGGPVTLTDKSMTRFIMSMEQSVKLVMDAAQIAAGGEVFVTKMPVANIHDLATVMVEVLAPTYGHAPSDIPIQVIGPRLGEKLYEELLSSEETHRARELGDYIVVRPPTACRARTGCELVHAEDTSPVLRPYNSSVEDCMSQEELRIFLSRNGLLDCETGWEAAR